MSISGFQFLMYDRIVTRLEKVGAISKEKAVTVEEAALDLQERQWLSYFAGVFLGEIKKTEDKRYYV